MLYYFFQVEALSYQIIYFWLTFERAINTRSQKNQSKTHTHTQKEQAETKTKKTPLIKSVLTLCPCKNHGL